MAVLYNERQIDTAIRNTARSIENDIRNDEHTSDNPLTCICILNGAMYFFTRLTQYLKNTILTIDTLGVKSYGNLNQQSTIDCYKKLNASTVICDRDILIVEDIIDSGNTMKFILDMVKKENPKSIRVATLINRRNSNVVKELHNLYDGVVFYKCLEVGDEWIYGYGLDLNQTSRELTMICSK